MNTRFIGLDSPDLLRAVPAIFAKAPSEKVSESYTFVPTQEVIQVLENSGWGITSARQQKARKSDPNTGKHTVAMRHKEHKPAAPELGSLSFQVHIVNSHDWSSRLEISLGMFRLVCSNGLIAHSGNHISYSVRHDRIHDDIRSILGGLHSAAQRMLGVVHAWNEIRIDPVEFGREAARLRFPTIERGDLDTVASRMVEPRRPIDAENTLWNVYNRAQEAGMRGGFKVRKRAARGISNISAEFEFNQELWKIAEKYAGLLTP